MSPFTVLSKSTTIAGTPVKPGKTYPLSPLDHAMSLHTLQLVFYYPRSSDPGSMSRDRLKESLTDVLSHYPAVTGRLVRGTEDGNWVVKCNDAGVRVIAAKVDIGLEEWLRNGNSSDERRLAYWEEMGDDPSIWSPFYIQVSEFKDGGVAIGLSCTHMHADPTCATLLIKAWGDAHRRSCIANPPFFHPPGLRARPTPNTNTKSAELLASKSKSATSSDRFPGPTTKMSTATFRFSERAVKKCLSDIITLCPSATPFDALASLFWWRIKGSGHVDGDDVSPHVLTLAIDFRKLMHAPLPHGFFGNALHFSQVTADLKEGWALAAAAVRRHVAGLVEEEYWSAVDWVESRKDPASGRFGEPFRMYGPELTCVNLEHMFAYGSVFERNGGGKPAHVSYHVGGVDDGDGLILVLPSPEEGMGRTVMVTLPKDRTDKIRRDEVILGYEPTILFNGGSVN